MIESLSMQIITDTQHKRLFNSLMRDVPDFYSNALRKRIVIRKGWYSLQTKFWKFDITLWLVEPMSFLWPFLLFRTLRNRTWLRYKKIKIAREKMSKRNGNERVFVCVQEKPKTSFITDVKHYYADWIANYNFSQNTFHSTFVRLLLFIQSIFIVFDFDTFITETHQISNIIVDWWEIMETIKLERIQPSNSTALLG